MVSVVITPSFAEAEEDEDWNDSFDDDLDDTEGIRSLMQLGTKPTVRMRCIRLVLDLTPSAINDTFEDMTCQRQYRIFLGQTCSPIHSLVDRTKGLGLEVKLEFGREFNHLPCRLSVGEEYDGLTLQRSTMMGNEHECATGLCAIMLNGGSIGSQSDQAAELILVGDLSSRCSPPPSASHGNHLTQNPLRRGCLQLR